jgi:hypothetical protein
MKSEEGICDVVKRSKGTSVSFHLCITSKIIFFSLFADFDIDSQMNTRVEKLKKKCLNFKVNIFFFALQA